MSWPRPVTVLTHKPFTKLQRQHLLCLLPHPLLLLKLLPNLPPKLLLVPLGYVLPFHLVAWGIYVYHLFCHCLSASHRPVRLPRRATTAARFGANKLDSTKATNNTFMSNVL